MISAITASTTADASFNNAKTNLDVGENKVLALKLWIKGNRY